MIPDTRFIKHTHPDANMHREILLRAFKYDDKPHQLYSAIANAAEGAGHEEAAEIRRLMDIEYARDRSAPDAEKLAEKIEPGSSEGYLAAIAKSNGQGAADTMQANEEKRRNWVTALISTALTAARDQGREEGQGDRRRDQ